MKTADTIEQQEERKKARDNRPDARFPSATSDPDREAKRRRSLANLKPFPKGVSGNPSGRRKGDTAAQVARAIFESNPEMIYEAFAKALAKGNAYAFQVLADRGYGKLKEQHAIEVSPFRDMTDDQLRDHISELKEKLGVRHSTPEPRVLPPADNDTDRKVQ